MITKETLRKSFWALPVHEALDALETTASGLMRDEAEERLRVFGKNVLAKRIRITKLKILVRQFGSPLIFLLLIAGGVTLFLKDFKDAGFILAAALINAILGFYQESKAETALAHLRTYIRERNRVFRDNHEIEVDSSELAPGDVIHLSQGDRIPADCRLIYVNDFAVDQAILTGESLPVSKDIKPASFQAVLADQNSMVFSGTVAVQGFANAVVSDEVVSIFDAAGIKKPNIAILSDEFLDEVRNLERKNVALELLKKLLNDEVRSMSKKFLVKSRSFCIYTPRRKRRPSFF